MDDDRNVQDEDFGLPMTHFKPNKDGTIEAFEAPDIDVHELGDKQHLNELKDLEAKPGKFSYMKKAGWRKGEDALKAYDPLYRILDPRNKNSSKKKPFNSFAKFLEHTKSAIDRFKMGKSKDRVATHVTMCGSNFEVKQEDEDEFLEIYAALISSGCKCFFVERPTEVYRYFCDFDFKQLSQIPDMTLEAAAIVVQRVICRFYPSLVDDEAALRAIVCTTDAKRVEASGKTPVLVKTGMHILWPGLYVSLGMSNDIRESILVEMQIVFGSRAEPSNSWEDVVDASVYPNLNKKGSGLRMLGSCKSIVCKACKGGKNKDKTAAICDRCEGIGKLDEGRPYFPLMVLTTSGKRDIYSEIEYLENMHKLILDTKIRTPSGTEPTAGYTHPDGAPRFLENDRGRVKHQGGTDVIQHGGKIRGLIGSLPQGQKVLLDSSDCVFDHIQKLIQSHACGMYSEVLVNQLTTNAKRSKYTVHITGRNSHYCQNKGAEHNSNRVFFEFDSTGFVQKCYSDSKEIRIHGPCSSFTSRSDKIPQEISYILFPDSKNTNLAAQAACRSDTLDESEPNFLSKKMRPLLLAGDFLSNFLFGTNQQPVSTQKGKKNQNQNNDGQVCKWSRTLRNEGKCFVNVGSGSGKMDTYVEFDPCALGTRKRVLTGLGFQVAEMIYNDNEDDDDVFSNDKKHRSLASLQKNIFKRLQKLVDEFVDFDQIRLRKRNYIDMEDDFEKGKGNGLREYDAETLLQIN